MATTRGDTRSERTSSDRWWLLIGGRAVLYLLWVIASLVVILTPGPADYLIWFFYAAAPLYLLFTIATPVALYFDRQYVAAVSSWAPSRIWYIMVIPAALIGDLFAFMYLYNRHERVGVP